MPSHRVSSQADEELLLPGSVRAVSDTGIAYYTKNIEEPSITALRLEDGATLWHWQTPDSVRSLLALWGSRIPWLLADSAGRMGSTLAAAFAEPSRERANTLRQEISQGQWRCPYGLHGAVNAMWLLASTDTVFLGTRLGVFALQASDGRLLWHALPTVDVSFFPATLSDQ